MAGNLSRYRPISKTDSLQISIVLRYIVEHSRLYDIVNSSSYLRRYLTYFHAAHPVNAIVVVVKLNKVKPPTSNPCKKKSILFPSDRCGIWSNVCFEVVRKAGLTCVDVVETEKSLEVDSISFVYLRTGSILPE